jgi:hypothetical protein
VEINDINEDLERYLDKPNDKNTNLIGGIRFNENNIIGANKSVSLHKPITELNSV